MGASTYEVVVKGDVGLYTGDDKEAAKENFANEVKFGTGVSSFYKVGKKTTFTASYYLAIANEDNDIVEGSKGMQNLIKTGMSHVISENASFGLMYKFDSYMLDRTATAAELAATESKKEAAHQWFDGIESWQAPRDPFYEGYTTHEVKATLSVSF
jgi:hypothetical protein